MPHEPKRRHSRERKGKRRASIKMTLPVVSFCKNCGTPIEAHTACKACGFYKGKKVLNK
ncbi:MAG: 50S ribosomal protein L32 [Candidatus Levybacteria bacterium CG10_big_fil_rev_8_21_14_0_10_36_7]|nr:MAG: 50S ribosomal protein L32 [Candidatus Levybacteria bacterium CG10_big_fil_rev_8_21_14_0_10_36_7]